ncbi:MAG TPA: RES family NAD+ phosphorylase [Candidatus Baltobacteraceae bacterium]|nr:RES family NAD+ phosphorylase [Candidatus Baltobacteraceae bacterium]
MRVWRVSRHRDLTGIGGLYVAGRWHTRGHLITYAGEHPATAQLEWLAHLDVTRPEDAPTTIPFCEIDLPDDLVRDELTETDLPPGWQTNQIETQRLGDSWLDAGKSAVIFVPSVLVPARNVLLNPQHPHAVRVRIVRSFDHPFDNRFLR